MGVKLLFKGAPGYVKSYSGHTKGTIREYDEVRATYLLNVMGNHFEVYEEKRIPMNKPIKKEEKKQESMPDNKMAAAEEDKSNEAEEEKHKEGTKLKRRFRNG